MKRRVLAKSIAAAAMAVLVCVSMLIPGSVFADTGDGYTGKTEGDYTDESKADAEPDKSDDPDEPEDTTYTISISDIESSEGSITVTSGGDTLENGSTVAAGTEISVSVSANEGYYLVAVKLGGEDQTISDGECNITNYSVNADTGIAVTIVSEDEARPSVTVEMDEEGVNSSEAEDGYYNVTRTATIRVSDYIVLHDDSSAASELTVKAKDAENADADPGSAAVISAWTASGSDSSKKYTYTTKVTFSGDACYEWSYKYTNKAKLSCEAKANREDADHVYSFTIDKTAPEVSDGAKTGLGDDMLWKTVDTESSGTVFGHYKNSTDSLSVSLDTSYISDATSPVRAVLYYKTDSTDSLTKDELAGAYEDGDFSEDTITFGENEYVTVYARITDYAGNTLYVGSDGLIIDTTQSSITLVPDEPDYDNGNADVYGYYTSDVNVAVSVTDEIEGVSAYSGIKSVDYTITSDGVQTASGNLYTFE
ncbi:MAG: hypothetical protein LUC41_05865, partial [Clostridiales bacterium]|nr:hypothetical protein [Clostridiales bacterium]